MTKSEKNELKKDLSQDNDLDKKEEEIIYIGETSNILERSATHSKQTTFSALRRSIGKSKFKFNLEEEKKKNRVHRNP